MSGIKLRWYFTELVEHYLRLGVRYQKATSTTSQRWLAFTRNWLDRQSSDDKDFIYSVFAYQFRDTAQGLSSFVCKEPVPLQAKRERLARLEKQFALDAGLCGEELEAD